VTAAPPLSLKDIRQGIYEAINVKEVTDLLESKSAGIVHGMARDEIEFPMIVINQQSGVTVSPFGAQRTVERNGGTILVDSTIRNTVWLVKAVDRSTGSARAEAIDEQLYRLLHFRTLTLTRPVPGGTAVVGEAFHIERGSDVSYVETDGDVQYRHVGGNYRVWIQATA
jgi:hypothetical protein